MSDRRPDQTQNLDGYGHDPLPWSRAQEALEPSNTAEVTWFLGTAEPDGRPHAAGVGALWHDGELYFTSSPTTRKSRNIVSNPQVSVGVRLEGIDLVFEGRTARVTDQSTLDAIAEAYNEGGWPTTVDGDALTAPFSAPSAGPPPWYVHRVDFQSVYGVATAEPQGATKWVFSDR